MHHQHGKMWTSKSTGRSAIRTECGLESLGFLEAISSDQFTLTSIASLLSQHTLFLHSYY
eukprot:UN25804